MNNCRVAQSVRDYRMEREDIGEMTFETLEKRKHRAEETKNKDYFPEISSPHHISMRFTRRSRYQEIQFQILQLICVQVSNPWAILHSALIAIFSVNFGRSKSKFNMAKCMSARSL